MQILPLTETEVCGLVDTSLNVVTSSLRKDDQYTFRERQRTSWRFSNRLPTMLTSMINDVNCPSTIVNYSLTRVGVNDVTFNVSAISFLVRSSQLINFHDFSNEARL